MKKESNQNITPSSVIRAISWLWIFTGVITGIIGIWATVIFFIFSGYKSTFEAFRADNPVFENIIGAINSIPIAAAALFILAALSIYAGRIFAKFKAKAIMLIEILSYLIITIAALISVFWTKIWWFSLDYIGSDTGSLIWHYIGLISGLAVTLFYILVMSFVIKTVRNKSFRAAYKMNVKV